MITRAKSIVIAGLIVAGIGLVSGLTLWTSSLGRYMYVEDLAPNVSPEVFRKLVGFAPLERAALYAALAFVVLGALLVVFGAVRRNRRTRRL